MPIDENLIIFLAAWYGLWIIVTVVMWADMKETRKGIERLNRAVNYIAEEMENKNVKTQ